MNTILLIIAVLFLFALIAATIHLVLSDGYGLRPVPRSHLDPFRCRPSDLC